MTTEYYKLQLDIALETIIELKQRLRESENKLHKVQRKNEKLERDRKELENIMKHNEMIYSNLVIRLNSLEKNM